MKKRKLLFKMIPALALCLAIGLSSCSDDPEGDIKGGKGIAGEGYFAIVVRTSNGSSTRANTLTETGIPIESKVNKIRIVLYDPTNPSNMPVKYAFDYTNLHIDPSANNNQGDLLGEDIHDRSSLWVFTPKAQSVAKKDYKMLIIINPTAEMISRTQVNQTYSGFYDFAHKCNVEELIGTGKDNFVMTNWQGLVSVEAQNIGETEDEAYTKKTNIYVDRAVSKVVVDYKQEGGTTGNVKTTNGTATVVAWGLDVTNKSTYYIRHSAEMNNGQPESKLVDDRKQFYAIDPNYQGYSLSYYNEYFAANGTDPYTMPDNPVDPIYGLFNTIGLTDVNNSWGADTWEYMLENTMQAVEQYRDVSTAVIMAVDYIPATSSIDDQVLIGAVPYYSYGGYVFTGGQLDEIEAGNIDVDDHPLLKNMVADLTAAKAVFGTDFASYSNSDNFSSNHVLYHANATNYYRIPIRHFDDVLQPVQMAYGRFGVVRNNVYKVTLSEIKGAGGIDFTKPEDPSGPKGPDESTDGWIVSQIEILDWVVRGQEINAGDPVNPIPEES